MISNPILRQTIRKSSKPTWVGTLVLAATLLMLSVVAVEPLRRIPAPWLDALRGGLLFAAWLLPLLTLGFAAALTAREDGGDTLHILRISPLNDHQVLWGYSLATLYRLRLLLAAVIGVLPLLSDEQIGGVLLSALIQIGLHLLAALCGTLAILRWGPARLSTVLIISVSGLLVNSLSLIRSPESVAPVCLPMTLSPLRFQSGVLLLQRGLRGPIGIFLALLTLAILVALIGRVRWNLDLRWPALEAVGVFSLCGLILAGNAALTASAERRALTAFYHATNGPKWEERAFWLTAESICGWQDVDCICGQVVSISLHRNDLAGPFPPAIGMVTSMQVINLRGNALTQIPAEIGMLKNLEVLYVDINALETIPYQIGTLQNLQSLDISNNQLERLPASIGKLHRLTSLDVEFNQLVEVPATLGELENLYILQLNNNQLTELPPEIGTLSRLEDFNVANNQLTVIPPEVGQLTNLIELRLAGNRLTALPEEIGALRKLDTLDLEDNQLTDLPATFGDLARLRILRLDANQMTDLPPELTTLSNLSYLLITDNKLTEVPPDIADLTSLRTLDLAGNPITAVPVDLIMLNDLRYLGLQNTTLISLPAELCDRRTFEVDPAALCVSSVDN